MIHLQRALARKLVKNAALICQMPDDRSDRWKEKPTPEPWRLRVETYEGLKGCCILGRNAPLLLGKGS